MMMAAILALQVATAPGPDQGATRCSNAEEVALSRAAELIGRGDDPLASEPALQRAGSVEGCDAIILARTSLLSWNEARALARIGGDPAPVSYTHLTLPTILRV